MWCFGKVLYSSITNLIILKIQCFQCLCEMKKKMIIEKMNNIWKNITWLFRSASVRHSAPTTPIWLLDRCSVVNVYVTCGKMIIEKINNICNNVTWLFRSASARYCAPTTPIWLLERFSVVNVYVRCEKNDYRENRWHLKECYLIDS